MSQQKIRLCSAPRLACAVIAFICGSLIYAMWFGMNSDRDNVHPIITKLMPAGHCTCQTSTSFQCADCLSCLPSSPSEQPQTEPQSWSFEYGRDGRNLSLTRSQCQASFPGLFEDILRGVAYWAARGGVTVPDLDTIQLQNPMVRAMIYNGELYIIESRAKGRDHRVKILAALSSIARALASSPERGSIPHIEFVFSAEDRVDDVNGAGLPIWTFSRKAGEESAWLMPDFGYWAWGHWSRDIGSYGQAVDRVKATEAGLGFRDKERKLVWRGKLSFAPKLRRALLDTARDTPWGDVRELEWASQTNFLSMEDHCRYMFIAHVEGIFYFLLLGCQDGLMANTNNY